MKRRMQKLLSICLSAAMVMTMTVPTFAGADMQVVTENASGEKGDSQVETGQVEDALGDNLAVEESENEPAVETKDTAIEEVTKAGASYETVMDAIFASYKDTTNPWAILDMVKAGKKGDLTAIDTCVKEAGDLINTSTSATDIEKSILVLSALGYDASDLDVNGTKVNGISKLTATDLSTINAVVFALSAIDSGNYSIPKDSKVTRETLISSLLGMKLSDGGWSFNSAATDPDMTAMAIVSLAPYYNAADGTTAGISEELYSQVKTAVNGAIERLSAIQSDDGIYASNDVKNANSCAMVMVALSSVGVDCVKDSRFVKNGKSVMDGLMTYALDDNSGMGFSDNTTANALATEQGLRGMVCYSQFVSTGKAFNIYASGSLDQVNVTLTLVGDDKHGAETPHTAYYTWIQDEQSYADVDHKTAMDVLKDVTARNGFALGIDSTYGYVNAITTPDGDTLAENDNALYSGWMYSVNNESPTVGMGDYVLSDGDAVMVYYSDAWGDVIAPISQPVKSIELSNASVYTGATKKLSVAVKPSFAANTRVTWESADPSVASVDSNGVVSGKKAGKAEVKATASDGSGVVATCTVTVKKPTIKLTYSTLPIQKGKSTKVIKIKSASPSTEKIKSAKSSKTNIATVKVSKGVLTVTGKKNGTATITVTSTNGATATVKITVKSSVNVSKLTMNKTKATLKKGAKVTLKVTKTPVTATNKITWTSSNKAVATVSSSGVVTAKKKGTATITVKSSNGKKATCKITVK